MNAGGDTGGQRRIAVVLADDHEMFREGMRFAIAETEDLELVGEAREGDQALELIRSRRPDVALLDVQMPGVDGLTVCEQLAAEPDRPRTALVILSAYDDEAFVSRAREAGAVGYLSKYASRDEILDVLRDVAAGQERFPARGREG